MLKGVINFGPCRVDTTQYTGCSTACEHLSRGDSTGKNVTKIKNDEIAFENTRKKRLKRGTSTTATLAR